MEAAAGADAPRPKKMSGTKDWFQNSQVPSFAQILKKNLPIQSSTMTTPPGYSPSEDYNVMNLASKVTEITESLLSKVVPPNRNTARPKKISKEFVMKYRCGEINPMSALHQFAQMRRVQLDFKETVKTGDVKGPYFAFCAVVNGIQYKTGLGRNKKESRSNAAKFALDELLQLDDSEPGSMETLE